MFLLRAAFWLSIVIILLPADTETGDKAPRVTAFEALVAAQTAVSDISQFCDRNPDVCDTGGTAFNVLADKVRNGAKIIYGYFGDEKVGESPKGTGGTLTPDDIEPAWHDPVQGDEAA